MQKITLYATANETLASVRDSANARSASAPVFVRDVEVELHLRLFANANEQERYVLPSGIVLVTVAPATNTTRPAPDTVELSTSAPEKPTVEPETI